MCVCVCVSRVSSTSALNRAAFRRSIKERNDGKDFSEGGWGAILRETSGEELCVGGY